MNLISAALLLLPASLAPTTSATAPQGMKELRAKFEELAEKQDRNGLVELWKANRGAVLPAIDRDLEASLKEIESGKPPDMAKVKKLHERALFGAECAVAATGHPILLDYASSFVGWNAEQQRQFRDGQKVAGAAGAALEKGDAEVALAKARETVERASALGDWWGTQMGYDALGRAYHKLGGHEDALNALSKARLLSHDLGLVRDEYQQLALMAELCQTTQRWQRGKACTAQALELARKVGDKEGEAGLTTLAAKFAEKLSAPAAK